MKKNLLDGIYIICLIGMMVLMYIDDHDVFSDVRMTASIVILLVIFVFLFIVRMDYKAKK